MSYTSCPTCGYFLGNKLFEFEKNKKLIIDDPKLDDEEKADNIVKLIKSLKLRRYCCTSRIITYVDYIDIF